MTPLPSEYPLLCPSSAEPCEPQCSYQAAANPPQGLLFAISRLRGSCCHFPHGAEAEPERNWEGGCFESCFLLWQGAVYPGRGGAGTSPSCHCSVPTALPQEMLSTGSPLMSIARVLPILITLYGPSRQEKFPRKALGTLRSEEGE